MCVCISLCISVVHNTAQNSSDSFPSYPPDIHHNLDDAYRWQEVILLKRDLNGCVFINVLLSYVRSTTSHTTTHTENKMDLPTCNGVSDRLNVTALMAAPFSSRN